MAEHEAPDAPSEEERELVIDEAHSNEGDFERLIKMDEQWPDHFEERSHLSREQIDEAGERKLDAMANMVARPQSLQDYLYDQLGWFDLDPEIRALADRIIANLDSNGYLQGRLEDLLGPESQQGRPGHAPAGPEPGATARSARRGRNRSQGMPAFAIDPGHALLRRIKDLDISHLEDLEHNRLPIISRRTGYSVELIHKVLVELRKLNPKPGADFTNVPVPPVTPDVFVEQDEYNRYRVRLEDSRTPGLHISAYYRQLLQNPETSNETREYIKRKVNSAQWLIDSIEQRRNTLTKVAQAIVDHQTEFLNKGPESIEPLKMQQIADKVGVHVTTVSRAVDDKWIQTPRGIFPLKRFFCGGTVSAEGEEVAWDAVRLKLQEIIDKEDKQHPLSDEQLVKEMAAHGLTVARRTVTKYRKAMGIPSSRQRRDWTAAKGEKPAAGDDKEE